MNYRRAFLIISIVLIYPHAAHAGLIINEIMYDLPGTDTNHEWIELYNNGSDSVSLDGLKFNDGANHGLNPIGTNGSSGSMTIPAQGYGILSGNATQFIADYPNFEGTVIDTVMSLTNDGGTISLIDSNENTIDSMTYASSEGGAGDGNSLGSFGSELVPGTPTPGGINTRTAIKNNSDSSNIAEEVKVSVPDEPVLQSSVAIIYKDPITRGVPVAFSTLVVGPDRRVTLTGKYVWNMGDGSSFEYEDGRTVSHIYEVPGDYVIIVEYYRTPGAYMPEVVVKKTVHVSDTELVISSLGTIETPYVEVTNKSDADVDASGWILQSGGHMFVIPKNTTILKGKKVAFPSSITGLGLSLNSGASLVHPNGRIISYLSNASTTIASTARVSSKSVSVVPTEGYMDVHLPAVATSATDPVTATALTFVPEKETVEVLDPDSQSAVAITAAHTNSWKPTSSFVYYLIFGMLLFFVIVVSLRISRASRSLEQVEHSSDEEADEFTLVE